MKGPQPGEKHPRAKLTDAEVDLMRELHEAGWTLVELAEVFETSKGHAHDLVTCRRRAVVRVFGE